MIFTYFVLTILFLIVSRNQNNKIIGIFAAFLMIVVFIAGNHTNLDYDNYSAGYENLLEGHVLEWGYLTLSAFCNKSLHLSYDYFRLLITFIATAILFLSLRGYLSKYNKYTCDLCLLFIIFPFFWDIPVHRNFLGFPFLVLSLRFLDSFNLKNFILFVGAILLAASFQVSYLLYLPLSLIYLLKNKKTKWLKGGIFVLFALTFMPGSVLSFMQDMMTSMGDDRMKYVDKVYTKYGYLLNIAEQSFVFIVARYGYKLAQQDLHYKENDEYRLKLFSIIETIYYISMIGFAYCCLYRIQGNFVRLLFNQIPLVYIQYACLKTILSKNSNKMICHKRNVYTLLVYIYAVFFFFMVFISHWDDIILPAFSDNWIIDYLIN